MKTSEEQPGAVVTVEHDGPGISGEGRPHVFERLYVARHTPRIAGSGSRLGLTTVAEPTEVTEGTVSVTARRPAGTRFTVQLPAAEQWVRS